MVIKYITSCLVPPSEENEIDKDKKKTFTYGITEGKYYKKQIKEIGGESLIIYLFLYLQRTKYRSHKSFISQRRWGRIFVELHLHSPVGRKLIIMLFSKRSKTKYAFIPHKKNFYFVGCKTTNEVPKGMLGPLYLR